MVIYILEIKRILSAIIVTNMGTLLEIVGEGIFISMFNVYSKEEI